MNLNYSQWEKIEISLISKTYLVKIPTIIIFDYKNIPYETAHVTALLILKKLPFSYHLTGILILIIIIILKYLSWLSSHNISRYKLLSSLNTLPVIIQ